MSGRRCRKESGGTRLEMEWKLGSAQQDLSRRGSNISI